MRTALGSLLLFASTAVSCAPPRSVANLGTAPDLGLRVASAPADRQFAVTLGRPAYVAAIEVTMNQGARLLTETKQASALAPGEHVFAPFPPREHVAAQPVAQRISASEEACPVPPFYREVSTGDTTAIEFQGASPMQPTIPVGQCFTDPNRQVTPASRIPPDRYILVVASPDSLALQVAAERLSAEDAVGGVREVLDRIARSVAGRGAVWSAAAIRVL
jgi:hypothetical protein